MPHHLPTSNSTFPPPPSERHYHSTLSIWLSVDPMSDKYPGVSPYVYCANNPVRLVDPNGRDIWEINEEGRIVSHNTTYKEKDIFYRVDNNGKRVGSVSFDPGTIEKQKSISYSPDGKRIDTYDVYQVRGDENGTKLFVFLAQTVSDAKIEVAHFQCGLDGDKGLNFISCAHEKPYRDIRDGESCIISTDRSLWYLFSGQLKYGYTIRAINHSHPDETFASPADISCKLRISDYLKKNGRTIPKFSIYHVPTGEYITY